jgi:hypothetical protein
VSGVVAERGRRLVGDRPIGWVGQVGPEAGAGTAGTVPTDPVNAALQLAGVLVLSGVTTAVVAVAYRTYTRERFPAGLATLVGLAATALYRQSVSLLGQLSTPGAGGWLFTPETVGYNLLALGVAAVGAPLGRSIGDRVAADVVAVAGAREVDADLGRVARAVGRVRAVQLPASVRDMDGYDPVPAETKTALAGKQLLFPRRLTDQDLTERLAVRLKEDYDVGHVDVEVADGAVTYLAVGSRAAGVGHTLAPGTAAVAVQAASPPGAGPGDLVRVWRADADERVLVAELRGVVDGVATLVVDETDATVLDATSDYRLTALSTSPRADREFATLLRAADESLGVRRVEPDDDLVGRSIGSIDATVVAVRAADGPVESVPARSRTIAAGDAVYLLGRPELLRRLGAS